MGRQYILQTCRGSIGPSVQHFSQIGDASHHGVHGKQAAPALRPVEAVQVKAGVPHKQLCAPHVRQPAGGHITPNGAVSQSGAAVAVGQRARSGDGRLRVQQGVKPLAGDAPVLHDAEASFKRVLLQYEKEGGPNNPRLKPVLGLLSQMSSAAGRPRDAQAYTMRAARIRD
eukprot:gene39014-48182_t